MYGGYRYWAKAIVMPEQIRCVLGYFPFGGPGPWCCLVMLALNFGQSRVDSGQCLWQWLVGFG